MSNEERDGQRTGASPLVAAYFDRRDDLRRFFAARLGSMEQAEDIVQDLYLKVAGLPSDLQIDNPAGYLYRLATNLMLDQRRQRLRATARDTAWRDVQRHAPRGEDEADEPSAEDALSARRRLARLAEALEELPLQTQRVFRLHKFEGLTHAETAERLGMSRRMVEKHVSAALKALLARIGPP